MSSKEIKNTRQMSGQKYINPSVAKTQAKLQQPSQQTNYSLKTIIKQNNLLTEAVKIRDLEIQRLKDIVQKCRNSTKKQRNVTMESQNDQRDFCFGSPQFQQKGMAFKFDEMIEQIENLRQKCSKYSLAITDYEQKLKLVHSNSINMQQNLTSQINTLKQQAVYLKQSFERNTDSMKIQTEHRHQQRIKVVQTKFKKEIEILKDEIDRLRHNNDEKQEQINRLTQKIKKNRLNQQKNTQFLQKLNSQLTNSMKSQESRLCNKMREREQMLVAQFQTDLEILHKQQGEEIRLLCERIRSLKKMIEQRDSQIKELWKAREQLTEKMFTSRQAQQKKITLIKQKQNKSLKVTVDNPLAEMKLQSIQKYLKN